MFVVKKITLFEKKFFTLEIFKKRIFFFSPTPEKKNFTHSRFMFIKNRAIGHPTRVEKNLFFPFSRVIKKHQIFKKTFIHLESALFSRKKRKANPGVQQQQQQIYQVFTFSLPLREI